jgi:hypothetical protein
MKAIMPKSWDRLPDSEKKKIEQVKEEEIERRMLVILDIFLKMSCISLNETEGKGENSLNCYLGNFYHIFEKHKDLVQKGEQMEFLDAKIRKIFRKHGYPDEFFRSMFGDKWDIYTGNMANTDKNYCDETDLREFLNSVNKYDSLIAKERETIEYLTREELPGNDKLIEECETRISAMKQTKVDVLEAISKLSDPVARSIFTSRYVRCEPWKQIAKSTGGMSERNVQYIHKRALREFEEIWEKTKEANK